MGNFGRTSCNRRHRTEFCCRQPDFSLTVQLQLRNQRRRPRRGGHNGGAPVPSWGAAMKILVVEDEPKTGSYLKQGLTEAGFVVDLVRDGNDGLHAAVTESYDLIVLDIMLPGL